VADLLVLTNPLDPSRRRRCKLAAGEWLLDWLDAHVPTPVEGLQRTVTVNGAPCLDRTYRTRDADEVLVTFTPGGGELALAEFFVQSVFAYMIGVVINRLFAPSQPAAADTPDPSQVYGIAKGRNAARLGQPIPVIYGAVIATPDYACQPYTYFENNEQYLHAIFCLGMGEHTISELLIGDSSATPLPTSIAQWWMYLPSQHQSKFGVIQTERGVRENVVSCSNVADQELLAPNAGTGSPNYPLWYWRATNGRTSATPVGIDLSVALSVDGKMALMPQNPNIGVVQVATYRNRGPGYYEVFDYVASDYQKNVTQVKYADLVAAPNAGTGSRQWIGPFEVSKPGQAGTRIECDFVFPNGLYAYFDDGSGMISPSGILVTIEVTPINDLGGTLGPPVLYDQNLTVIVNPPNTPQRWTRTVTVASGRYRVRVARISDLDGKLGTQDRCLWTGLKFVLNDLPPTQKVYGEVTLVAVKLKATNGVAASASGSIRFRCTRRLAPLGLGTPVVTSNPADAFVDVVCAPYGGARPRNADELDLDELTASRAAWVGHNGFNAVFDQRSTVWEALGLVVQTVHAAPLPVGSRMSLIHDQVQPQQLQQFTDANIVAGSLKVNYAFDKPGTPEGIQVNWRDPRTFSPAVLLVPTTAVDFVVVDLFGCTSQAVAQEHANLIAAKRTQQRTTITFDTELEGLNLLPGDRIGVQAGMVQWAQGARVEAVLNPTTIRVDRALTWTPAATHAVQFRDETGKPFRVLGVTPGATPFEIVLPPGTYAFTGANADQEATTLSFGVQDAETTDWTVSKVTPQGDTVTIDATNYAPSIYAAAADFTRAPFALDPGVL